MTAPPDAPEPPGPTVVTDPWRLLRRDDRGLVPVVAQDWRSRDVLMLAWMDDEALARTLATGRATYWSRSRREYWVKGETSGHTQHVREVRVDCDGDTLLLLVEQRGPACHTGTTTCFDDGLVDHDAALASRPAGEPA